jgi:DNA polymerase zeta
MMIAYNYCFSTCLGKVRTLASYLLLFKIMLLQISETGDIKFGVAELKLPVGLLSSLYDSNELFVSPNGVLFCKPSTRQGVIPRMLDEILQTRVMVKRAMKDVPAGSALHRLLNSRQV